jgi:hypothetical protein
MKDVNPELEGENPQRWSEKLGRWIEDDSEENNGPDIQVRNEGTVMVFTPISETGTQFLNALETEDWQWIGPSLVVDHRPAYDLLEGMKMEGLEVVL